MKYLIEKKVHTNEYGGTADLITGIDDFDTPELFYDEEWHCYKLNGKIIPSVTQLLSDGTYEGIDKKVLEYAQFRGRLVHKEIENYLRHQEMGFTAEFYEFLRIYTQNHEIFATRAIFDYKTYNTNQKKNREKCYKQIKMYDEAIKYLTGEGVNEYFMIWLPHDKEGKVFNLRREFEKDYDENCEK